MKKFAKYLLERQRKLSAAILGAALLAGGLVVPCSNEKYSAYSLAITALFSVLVGSHVAQTIKSPPAEEQLPIPES
jgi:hypothetical protein